MYLRLHDDPKQLYFVKKQLLRGLRNYYKWKFQAYCEELKKLGRPTFNFSRIRDFNHIYEIVEEFAADEFDTNWYHHKWTVTEIEKLVVFLIVLIYNDQVAVDYD